MKIVKIPTSFLVFKIFIRVINFLLINIILNMTQVFIGLIFIFFSNLNYIDFSYYIAFLIVFLLVFIFLEGLGIKLTSISKREILSRLILIFIIPIGFILIFLGWSITFWTFRVNFLCFQGWLEVYFCFYISGRLYHFFLQI